MSFYTSLNGLKNAQTDLGVIAHNIANVETNGFKKGRTEFADIVVSSAQSNPRMIQGIGARVEAITQNFALGPVEQTGGPDAGLASAPVLGRPHEVIPLSRDALEDVAPRLAAGQLDDDGRHAAAGPGRVTATQRSLADGDNRLSSDPHQRLRREHLLNAPVERSSHHPVVTRRAASSNRSATASGVWI